MNITSVGYFREMPDGSPSAPPIKDYIVKGNASIIDKVCAYLDSGLPLIVSPGMALDIIDETKGSAGTLSILTDGKWAWSDVLSYYIKNYNLRLNDEFLETMISNGWQVQISESELDYSNINLDGEQL